jgi:hypothetical protein
MEVLIDGFEHLNEDTKPLFDASLVKASRYTASDLVAGVRLILNPRGFNNRLPGWLEYLLVINYKDKGQFVIGCLQRNPGEEVEFHS